MQLFQPYFTLNILRSSPRRHRGERTTTIPMKTPPLPVGFAVDGCTILCRSRENVPRKMRGDGILGSSEIRRVPNLTDQELEELLKVDTDKIFHTFSKKY